jgi:hypothetical protein
VFDAPFLIYLFAMVAYTIGSIAAIRFVWRRTAEFRTTFLRLLLRCSAIALLFSPTFLFCGAGILVPYPLVIAAEIYYGDTSCGQVTSMLAWNTLYVVVPVWLLSLGIGAISARMRYGRAL